MRYSILKIFLLLILSSSAFAQAPAPREKMTREEKDEKNAARQARIDAKNDYILFRKQIAALKEYSDEKRKLLKLQENAKVPVKVVIAIDSLDEGDTTKILTGYIVQNVGDNATLRYDITYDKTQKKIVSVKKTQEAIDADSEAKEERDEKAVERKKPAAKPGVPKKKSEDEDDDDTEEDKPAKGKDKDEE